MKEAKTVGRKSLAKKRENHGARRAGKEAGSPAV